MGATLLTAKPVARPWGRQSLPSGFERFNRGEAIGEIWHEPLEGDTSPLLVKHLFTAERLSIQVHPDDEAALALGLDRGKDEAWAILDAEPDARLGLGLVREVDRGELRDAALSGKIEQLVDWRAVEAGDFFYSPGGTIHAIGAGLGLIEIQQNSDVTYRLYDYGRPRELHLEQALAVADPRPWAGTTNPQPASDNRTILISGTAFVVEEWLVEGTLRLASHGELLAIPRRGGGRVDGASIDVGQVWSLTGRVEFQSDQGMTLLVAYPGGRVREDIDF